MNRFRFSLMVLLMGAAFCRADLDEAHVRRVKEATALVVNPQTGEAVGTAFCIDTAGYFVTSRRVAAKNVKGTLTLVLKPGGRDMRKLSARVVRTDEMQDLGLLKVEDPVTVSLTLAADEPLQAGMRPVGFGYDAGYPSVGDSDAPPGIVVIQGRVFEAPRGHDPMAYMEISRVGITPSHAGGPLLNDKGEVIGVIVWTVVKWGRSPDTPLRSLRAFLSTPVLRADIPESVPREDRYKPIRLKAAFDTPVPGALPGKPVLALNDGYLERLVHAEETPSGYVFETALLPRADPSWIRLRLTLADSVVTCFAEDVSLSASDGNHLLSELDAYEKNRGLLTRDGNTVALEAAHVMLRVYAFEKPLDIPMREIDAFDVDPIDEPSFVRYRLSSEVPGGVPESLEGTIRFSGIPGRPAVPPPERIESNTDLASLSVQAPEPFSGTIERQLPAPITGVTSAGGGRYLLLHMARLDQLAVFDLNVLKVVKIIALFDPKALVAGGASSFVLALPEQKVFQRWSLETLERDLIKMLPRGRLVNLAMGDGSEGPLLVRTSLDTSRFSFYDLQTLEPMPLFAGVPTIKRAATDTMRYRFSANGRTLAFKADGDNTLEVVTLSGNELKKRHKVISMGYMIPGPDGEYIYSFRGIFTRDLVPVTPPADGIRIPSTQPPYYVWAEHTRSNRAQLTVYVTDNPRPVIALPETPELIMTPSPEFDKDLTFDKRVHYVPRARLLVTLPTTENRVVVRYVDVEARLKEAGLDYFFVDSLPVKHIKPGADYSYRIRVKSKDDRVRYLLDTAPEGMTIDEKGLMSWAVPSDYTGYTRVVVILRNGDGWELRHEFTIEVLP